MEARGSMPFASTSFKRERLEPSIGTCDEVAIT